MTSEQPKPSALRQLPLRKMGEAVVGYLLITAAAAWATPILPGRNLPLAVWIGGGVLLFAFIARSVNHLAMTSSRLARMEVGIAVALAVTVVTAFVGFVVMVNIWERLGLGH